MMYSELKISKSINQNSAFNKVSILTRMINGFISTVSTLAIGDATVTESPDHRMCHSKAIILQPEEQKLYIQLVRITRIRM